MRKKGVPATFVVGLVVGAMALAGCASSSGVAQQTTRQQEQNKTYNSFSDLPPAMQTAGLLAENEVGGTTAAVTFTGNIPESDPACGQSDGCAEYTVDLDNGKRASCEVWLIADGEFDGVCIRD